MSDQISMGLFERRPAVQQTAIEAAEQIVQESTALDKKTADDLASLRNKLFDQANTQHGGICPCCDRFTKVYERCFNRAMAEALIWLYSETKRGKADSNGYVNIGDAAPRHVMRNGGSLASGRWWGLVEKLALDDDDEIRHSSGTWKITPRGIDFVEGKISIPSHVRTYNAANIGNSDTLTTISKSLKRPFNYSELMEGV
jgi:hypothetical protein